MKEKLISFLKKRDKISILSIEDTFFKHIKFDKKVKIDDNAIKLNYSHLSPYQDTDIINFFENENLYLWFYEHRESNKIVIPQGYILYNYLKKRYHDHIVVINDNPAKILVIKDSVLVSQTVKTNVDDSYIKSLQREYSISQKIANISLNEYDHIKDNALNDLNFSDFLKFSNFSFDKTQFEKIINSAAVPVLALVSFVVAAEYVQSFYIKYKIDSNKKIYKEYVEKNSKIRKKFDKVEEKVEKYKSFMHKEKNFSRKFFVTSELAKHLNDFNSTLRYIELSGNKATVTIKTKRQNDLIASLVKSDIFQNLKIESTHKDRKSGMEQVRFNAKIEIPKRENHE